MIRKIPMSAAGCAAVVVLVLAGCNREPAPVQAVAAAPAPAAASETTASGVPTFQADPSFFKIPNNWKFGIVSSVAVDRHDHVWVLQRTRTTQVPTPAPPVMEFDETGKYVQGWGGPKDGYDWPFSEHGIALDQNDNVWITGNNPYAGTGSTSSDDMLLKFTSKGKFVLQVGGRDKHVGNEDTKNVWTATDAFVYPKTNEIFVSDGYGNRRVVVFDLETGAYKRKWGAFGNTPTDKPAVAPPAPPPPPWGPWPLPNAFVPLDPAKAADAGKGPEQFSGTPHGIKVSNDGMVYVADRGNRRVQVFTLDGKYVTEGFAHREGPRNLSVSGVAFSNDPDQRFLYASDWNGWVDVFDRKTVKLLYVLGRHGARPGEFQQPHNIASDSKGNLYVAEVEPGNRAQKLVFMGISKVDTQ